MSNINYLEIEGGPRELGLAHGRAFGDLISAGLADWDTMIQENCGVTRDKFIESFLAHINYRTAIEKHLPHLLEEVEAIAEGAEQDPTLIFAWQLIDEWIDFAVENYIAAKCSSLGGYDQGEGIPPIIGKTQDLPHLFLDRTALIRTKTREAEFFNSGVVGVIAQDGLNDKGVGVCCNHIGHLARDPAGIPVAFLLRAVLERASSVGDAIGIAGSMSSASGMNYVFGDRERVADVEVSAHDVVDCENAPSIKRYWHTNHPLANENYVDDIDLWRELPDNEAGNTAARLASLEKSLGDPSRPLDLDCAKQALSSREGPVSALPEDDYPTINGLIVEFYDEPVLHFCVGAPVQGEWHEFRF